MSPKYFLARPAFLERFWDKCYPEYVNKYAVLQDMPHHQIYHVKVQKTKPTGGYHVWHCESADAISGRRVLVYTIYLNTIEEGGETEFLYYPRRVKAELGKLVLFPPGFTHTHRGNPPISGTKYIVTGWLEF